MTVFLIITQAEIPSVWKVSNSSTGGNMSARALLLIEPTNEMTRSSSGIRIASTPAKTEKRSYCTDDKMISGHCWG